VQVDGREEGFVLGAVTAADQGDPAGPEARQALGSRHSARVAARIRATVAGEPPASVWSETTMRVARLDHVGDLADDRDRGLAEQATSVAGRH